MPINYEIYLKINLLLKAKIKIFIKKNALDLEIGQKKKTTKTTTKSKIDLVVISNDSSI
jgi:hypothetical protein